MRRIMKFWCAALALAFAMPAQAQWSDDPKENTQLLDKSYWDVERQATSDGGFYMVTVSPDGGLDHVVPMLYRFDKDGKKLWDKPVEFPVDSTLSYIKVMSHLLVDKDDNAIVMHQSLCGYIIEKFTAWKVNKEGQQQWGEAGVILHGDEIPGKYAAAVRATQMETGEYVFAWMDEGIKMQKVSADGKLLWGTGKIVALGAYPHVMDAGDGDILLVYESSGLNVCRLDFEGNKVWDVKAFSGQLNSQIPSWTYVHVYPVEDPAGRGVLISYYGFVGNEHYSYISYVKADGTHAFPDADAGLRICYSENWGGSPDLVYDDKNKVIYAIFSEVRPGTNFYQRFAVQKISAGGELQWGNEGIELVPIKERTLGYASLAMGPDGNVLFGFMENIGQGISANDPIGIKMAYMNPEGKFIWDEEVKDFCMVKSSKYNLEIMPFNNKQWIVTWEDCRVDGGVDNGHIFGQNLYWDGSMGPVAPEDPTGPTDTTAVEDRLVAGAALQVTPNPIVDEARIAYTAQQSENVRLSLVSLAGQEVAVVFEGRLSGESMLTWQRPGDVPAGLYMMRLRAGDKTAAVKVVLR